MTDRRFQPRQPAREQAELSVPGDSQGQTLTGALLDLSRSGARLRVDRAVRLDAAARIKIRGKELGATVKSCVAEQAKYVVGVEFDHEYEGELKLS